MIELTDWSEEEPQQRFVIDSEDKAAWAVDKMLSFDERIDRVKAQYKAMITQLERDRDSFRARFEPELEAWLKENKHWKSKSVKFLTGTIGYRTVKGGARLQDEEAFMVWASKRQDCDAFLRVHMEPNKTAVKEWVESTGEIPPGVVIVDDAEKFFVRSAKSND